MRLAFVVCLGLFACLLLTGCGNEPDRREAQEPAGATREVVAPPASTPNATVAPTQPPTRSVSGSAGCGNDVEPGSSTGSVESDGIERTYRLYVPQGYKSDRPTALVINYHGYGASAQEQERYSEYPDAAERYGFVVVSPQATSSPSEWFLYGAIEAAYVDDFAFTGRLIDTLSASLCIDPARVYATGLSNGAGMAALTGCALSGRIAAIAPVAGEPYVAGECEGAGPVPIIAFHGTQDPLVPFEYSEDVGRPDIFRFGARNSMQDWARHNGCSMTLQTQRIAADVVLESYGGCKDGADVQLYVVEGGGHTWPGASIDMPGLGGTTRSISATELSWLFFAAHPRR
jgi:polyhydroxybutyrate depolymerase